MAVQVRRSRAFRTGSNFQIQTVAFLSLSFSQAQAGVYAFTRLRSAPTSYRASLWKGRSNLEGVIAFHTPINVLGTSLHRAVKICS